jgi:hypothetical protein
MESSRTEKRRGDREYPKHVPCGLCILVFNVAFSVQLSVPCVPVVNSIGIFVG